MNNITIDIDYADYKMINSHTGYSVGVNSKLINSKKFNNEIIEKFKHHLQKAKGVLIEFQHSQSYNITNLSNCSELLYNNTDDECDIILGTTIDKSLVENQLRISLLITGLDEIIDSSLV